MNSISEVLKTITIDLYIDKQQNKHKNFFYKSMLHYAISLEIAQNSYEGDFIYFDKLCDKIPKKFGCISSIKTVLDHGVDYGFFIKKSKDTDKRVKYYKLSEEYSLMITEWFLNKKAIFVN